MKRCPKCRKKKPLADFYRKGAKHVSECKACKARYNLSWYQRNKGKHLIDVKRNRDEHTGKLKALMEPMKAVPCADCGGRYPGYVMDFDHRCRHTKAGNISKMIYSGATTKALLDEIAKCDVVCSNCHRERTFGPRSLTGRAAVS